MKRFIGYSIGRARFAAWMFVLFQCFSFASPAAAQWTNTWFDNVTYTSPGTFNDQTRGYLSAGGVSARFNVENDYLMSLSLPKIKAGCGGIDMFLGGLSFLDPDYLIEKLENILQAAPAVAFQYALEVLDEKMGNIISKMEAATNYLNSIQVNDCRLANKVVRVATGNEGFSDVLEEMTGSRSVSEGFKRNYDDSRKAIQANSNNPTEDLKVVLLNCPASVTDVFKPGSILLHSATRIGAGSWDDVMRARVGDVWMKWDDGDKVPVFTQIPPCPEQETESPDDFLMGTVRRRGTGINTQCVLDGSTGAVQLVRQRLVSIAGKMQSKAALTPDETAFIANVKTVPVYLLLKNGIETGTVNSVISDVEELVAITMAYQMMQDLVRTIDYAVSGAGRALNSASSVDAATKDVCDTRVLMPAREMLIDVRNEAQRQRQQMRQSYIAALNQANLAASYADYVRQKQRDARDTSTASTVKIK